MAYEIVIDDLSIGGISLDDLLSAYWYGSVLFDLVLLASGWFGSVRFGSVRFNSIRFGLVRFGFAWFHYVLFTVYLRDIPFRSVLPLALRSSSPACTNVPLSLSLSYRAWANAGKQGRPQVGGAGEA